MSLDHLKTHFGPNWGLKTMRGQKARPKDQRTIAEIEANLERLKAIPIEVSEELAEKYTSQAGE